MAKKVSIGDRVRIRETEYVFTKSSAHAFDAALKTVQVGRTTAGMYITMDPIGGGERKLVYFDDLNAAVTSIQAQEEKTGMPGIERSDTVQQGDTIEIPGIGTFWVEDAATADLNTALHGASVEMIELRPVSGGHAVRVDLHKVVSAILQHGGLRKSRGTGGGD